MGSDMKYAFYILLLVSTLMCGLAMVATWMTCLSVIVMILLAMLAHKRALHSRRIRRGMGWIRNIAAGLTVMALLAAELRTGRGDADSWLLRCVIDLIFWLFVWRAFDHDTRAKRMQIVIVTMLPLAAMAYTLDAGLYLLCLLAYGTSFLACLSMESFAQPASGTTFVRSKRVGRSMRDKVRELDLISFGRRFAGVLLLIFILSFIAFFFMPRLSQNVAAVATATRQDTSHYPDIDLAKTGDIQLEQTLIFTADMPQTHGETYWRIDVQTRFDGTRWASGMAQEDHPPYREDAVTWHTLQFTQNWRDWHLPTLANTVALQPKLEDEENVQLRLYRNADGLWYRWGWRRVSLEGYRFARDDSDSGEQIPSVEIAERRRAIWPDLRPLFDWMYGRQPHVRYDQPSVRTSMKSSTADAALIWPYSKRDPYYAPLVELAHNITQDATTNLAKAEAVVDYLQTNYTYSLKRPVRALPIVADFLLNQKSGHCELFSSSMAVLLNKVGVPTRNVSGFMSSEYHDGKNYVRASHAHSWVEVYDDTTHQWIRFDPTPPSAVEQEVSAWVRFNDWFLTYRSRDLYRWIPLHLMEIACAFAIFLCGGGMFFSARSWMHQRWMRAAGCFVIALIALIVSFILGGKVGGMIALAVLLLMVGLSIRYISQLKSSDLWHHAMDTFRNEAKKYQHPLADFTLEEWWERAQTSRPDAINTFFDTGLRALYNTQEHGARSFWILFSDHIHIQKLLYRALQQLKQS